MNYSRCDTEVHPKDEGNTPLILFLLLLLSLLCWAGVALRMYSSRQTVRREVSRVALSLVNRNNDVRRLLGTPVVSRGTITGGVSQDETGWKEARLTVPVHGSADDGTLRLIGGRSSGEWVFSTLELDIPRQHKKVNLVVGRITEYQPGAYAEVHLE